VVFSCRAGEQIESDAAAHDADCETGGFTKQPASSRRVFGGNEVPESLSFVDYRNSQNTPYFFRQVGVQSMCSNLVGLPRVSQVRKFP
jgi:hypothetical protein